MAEFFDLDSVASREPVKGYKVRFVHSAGMTLAYWDVTAGSELPEHSHPHEQVASIISGQFEMTIDGWTRIMGSGAVAVIPGGEKHSGRALTDCRIIDAFHPVRQEYR